MKKNLGIICINTFDISPIEINRYDDFGNLIEKPSETFQSCIMVLVRET